MCRLLPGQQSGRWKWDRSCRLWWAAARRGHESGRGRWDRPDGRGRYRGRRVHRLPPFVLVRRGEASCWSSNNATSTLGTWKRRRLPTRKLGIVPSRAARMSSFCFSPVAFAAAAATTNVCGTCVSMQVLFAAISRLTGLRGRKSLVDGRTSLVDGRCDPS